MKKTLKMICMILILAVFASLAAGCGNTPAGTASPAGDANVPGTDQPAGIAGQPSPEPAQEKPLDLTGMWIQEDGTKDSYMAAVIREDGTIGVFFLLDGDDSPWVYWVGTYQAPDSAKDTYNWVSENTFAGIGLLASDAPTKEFTYQDGKLSYAVSIQDQTKTISLIRGEWDTSKIPEDVFASVKVPEGEFQLLEIKDSAWVQKNGYLYYYVVLHNPNKEFAVEFPSFRITARTADGTLLGTEDQTLSILYPEQDFVYGSMAFSVDQNPAEVTFEVMDVEDYNIKKADVLKEYKPLAVLNPQLGSDKVLGEIENLNEYDFSTCIVVAIFRNAAGELVGIENTFVDDIKAGKTTPFSLSFYLSDPVDQVKIFANQWD